MYKLFEKQNILGGLSSCSYYVLVYDSLQVTTYIWDVLPHLFVFGYALAPAPFPYWMVWYSYKKKIGHKYEGLFMAFQFYSIDVYAKHLMPAHSVSITTALQHIQNTKVSICSYFPRLFRLSWVPWTFI